MVIYFNDTFLQEEFFEYHDFKNAVGSFIKFSEVISKLRIERKAKIHFKASDELKKFFAEIGDVGLQEAFLVHLNALGVKFWNSSSAQSAALFYYFYDVSVVPPELVDVSGKTLAEAGATKRLGNDVLTLNLPDMKFSKLPHVLVDIQSKENLSIVERVMVDCADCHDSLNGWLERKIDDRYKYLDHTRTPLDDETCLANGFKFKRLEGKKSQGRQIFVDKSGQLWYVDNLHTGNSAHIEVFDKNGDHIGEADLDGQIDYSKVDPKKNIRI